MNILYIHQYFVTPEEPGATRSYWIAKEMIKAGHRVTMITSHTKYSEPIKEVNVEGIDVIYLKEDYNQNMSLFRRMWAFISFMYKASKVAVKQKNIDVVYATSTPLTIGVPALVRKWFKGTPFIFEVRDLWPEVPIQMEVLGNPILRGLALFLEKTIYKNAKHVVALSPGMQEGVVKYIDSSKTSMIPNMSKIEEFWPRERDFVFMESLGLSRDSFKIVHFGALGLANGAETIIESAKLLKDNSSIEFVFVGGGSTEKLLKEEVRKHDLKNVKFIGKFPMIDTSRIVNFCDVSIVSFKDLPILYTNSPNKLFDSLSAGKPIIVNSAGWTKDLVEKYDCGYYVNPHKAVELVDKVLYLQNNPEIVNKMGKQSRWLAENQFDKSILAKKVVNVIEKSIV